MRLGRPAVPERVQLDHDVHRGRPPRRASSRSARAPSQLVGRDVLAAVLASANVERPDLHRRDALGEQALGQLVGPVQEGVEILVGPVGVAAGRLQFATAWPRAPGRSTCPRTCCRCGCARGSARRAAGRAAGRRPARGCPRARRRPPSCPRLRAAARGADVAAGRALRSMSRGVLPSRQARRPRAGSPRPRRRKTSRRARRSPRRCVRGRGRGSGTRPAGACRCV